MRTRDIERDPGVAKVGDVIRQQAKRFFGRLHSYPSPLIQGALLLLVEQELDAPLQVFVPLEGRL